MFPSTAFTTDQDHAIHLEGLVELSADEIANVSGGNPLVPAAAAAVGIGGTALLAYGVYKMGKAIDLW